MPLDMDIRYIKGVGEKRAKLFEKLGVRDLGGLISCFPRDYEDRSVIKSIGEAEDGETVCVSAIVASDVRVRRIRKGLEITRVRAVDGKEAMELVFFNRSYVKDLLKPGGSYLFYGKITKNLTQVEMSNPLFIREDEEKWGIVPIYRLTAGLTQKMMQAAVKQGLSLVGEDLSDILPAEIRERAGLCHSRYAYENIHFPENWQALAAARKRLIFEELFIFSCGLSLLRGRRSGKPGIAVKADVREFIEALPFRLTGAQSRALDEILADLKGGRLMNRLVQGDVGSGKTVLAAAAAFVVAKSGYQTALMAPTEILAHQHFSFFEPLLSRFGISVTLLTGGMPAAEKREAQRRIAAGETDVIIGTHALITGGLSYKRLGLVITDEQHRFGVGQRAALAEKGEDPHLLVMSATPIPRTMALIIYGDLDISVIDELPPGRQSVDTFAVGEDKRERMYGFVRKQVSEGRQVYIVCPAVEEGENDGLKAAETHAEELRDHEFPDLRVALLHGRMKPREKESVMSGFAAGEYDILVATTVIEVGVDVPNATLMVVENAERFGLSQLHQLRGRVGRGKHKSYCVLVSDFKGETARDRFSVMCKSNDGFYIAEEDLRLRGPGDFFGSRQHGLPEMKVASLSGDTRILKEAQQEAERFINEGGAKSPAFEPLRLQIERLFDNESGIFN